MTTPNIIALVRQHQAIFSERDATRRAQLMAETYADDIQVIDPHAVLTGQAAVAGFIAGLQQRYPAGVFSQARPVEAHHHVAELHWQFGPGAQPAQVTGSDILVLANGKVQTLYIFVDGTTTQSAK